MSQGKKRGALVILVGPPGAGKTSWLNAGPFTRYQQVSLDDFRGWLTDDVSDMSADRDAVGIRETVVRARLSRGLLTVVDATNARAKYRAELVAVAREFGSFTVAVVFDVDLEECIRRQQLRGRKVPRDVTTRMDETIRAERPGLASEVDTVVTFHGDGRPRTVEGTSLPLWLVEACGGFTAP